MSKLFETLLHQQFERFTQLFYTIILMVRQNYFQICIFRFN